MMRIKKVTFEFDAHLIELARHKYKLMKGYVPKQIKFHQMVYDVGLRVLEREYKEWREKNVDL